MRRLLPILATAGVLAATGLALKAAQHRRATAPSTPPPSSPTLDPLPLEAPDATPPR